LPPRFPAALLPIEKKNEKEDSAPAPIARPQNFSVVERPLSLARTRQAWAGPSSPVASRFDRQGPRSPAFRRPRSPFPTILLARCLDPLVRTRRTSGVWRPGATLTPRLELAPDAAPDRAAVSDLSALFQYHSCWDCFVTRSDHTKVSHKKEHRDKPFAHHG
jgi:hypothetical protein